MSVRVAMCASDCSSLLIVSMREKKWSYLLPIFFSFSLSQHLYAFLLCCTKLVECVRFLEDFSFSLSRIFCALCKAYCCCYSFFHHHISIYFRLFLVCVWEYVWMKPRTVCTQIKRKCWIVLYFWKWHQSIFFLLIHTHTMWMRVQLYAMCVIDIKIDQHG